MSILPPPFRNTLLLAIAVAVTLSACSAARIAYRHADTLLAGYAEHYLDLSDAQSRHLRQRLAAWLEWHRRVQLPALRRRLQSVRNGLADGLTLAEARSSITALRDGYRSVIAGLLPVIADLLASLTPDQIRQLSEAFETSNREYRDELLNDTPEARRTRRLRWATKVAQRWVGDLQGPQKSWLEQQLQHHPSMAEAWLAYRVEQQQTLLKMLREHASREQIQRFLEEWMVERKRLSPSLATARQQLFDDAPVLLQQFDASLTARQRERGLERVDFYLDLAAKLTLPAPG